MTQIKQTDCKISVCFSLYILIVSIYISSLLIATFAFRHIIIILARPEAKGDIIMIDGKYAIALQTPIGSMRGSITLVTSEEKLSGTLEVNGSRYPFSGGSVHGERCSFSSDFNTAFGRIRVNIDGTVHDDLFKASGNTPMGMITAVGHRNSKP